MAKEKLTLSWRIGLPQWETDEAFDEPGQGGVRELWVEQNIASIESLMVGIMAMHNGDRKHGIDLPAILKAAPDCLLRVGEGHFDDVSFDPPCDKASLIESLETHKASVPDISRLYTENTVHPWPQLRPENMAKKLLIEMEHGLRNIMLMPPQLLDAPAYWEAIASVLAQAQAMAEVQAGLKK